MSDLRKYTNVACLLALALLVGLAVGGKGCDWKWPVPVTKVDAVVYVYEKDESAVPSPVMAALNTLNRQGIVATLFEDDTKDGTGETPEQYKVPFAAAKEAGMPALVATAGEKVVRVVKSPKTEAEVLEAAK